MANPKEVLERAYGNVPKEVNLNYDIDIAPIRSVKYYYHKLIRFFTR
jgi:hypothetical protein